MKSVKFAVVALLLGTVSFAGAAAQSLAVAPDDQAMTSAVKVSGSSSLISLEQQLSGKQDNLRVKPFRITSTSGVSKLSGTATSIN
ncbi:hypothetical protein [Pantoea sp. KPR_PJ]|uniref:hypothetical protein n=1 Tax=Pantoea sp. KPR_PJ TaxID=2738375 RepID=UPI003529BD97